MSEAAEGCGLRVGIVYDDTLDRPGGVGSYCRDLARELDRLGHHPEFLVGTSRADQVEGHPAHGLARNMAMTFNGNAFTIPAIPRRRRVRALLAQRRYDVVHVQMPYSPLMAQVVIDELPATTRLVGTFHVYSESATVRYGAQLLGRWTRETNRRFDQLLAVSEPAARFAKATMNLDTVVVPNMVDTARIRILRGHVEGTSRAPSDRDDLKTPHVVFVGNLVHRKGVEVLLRAFAITVRDLPSATLTIAGDGPLGRHLKQLSARLGISDCVSFVGHVDDAQKYDLLGSADVACFPSLYGESFGIVLAEAVAAGAGVVLAGRNPGYVSTFGDLASASCVDATDPSELARSLTELLSDPVGRSDLGARQVQRIQAYDSRRVIQLILESYGQTAGAPREPAHDLGAGA